MAGVACISMAVLFYEVLLTRIFSVTLWYHFGFLAISLAMLGVAAGAVLCFLFPDALAGPRARSHLAVTALGFAVLAPAAVAFHAGVELPGSDDAWAFYSIFGAELVLLFLAFLSAGLCIGIALFRYAAQVSAVYSFDLLGAAAGSVLVVPLLYVRSPLALVFGVSAAACGAATFFSVSRRFRVGLSLAAVACLALAAANDRLDLLAVRSIKDYTRGQFQRAEGETLLELWSPVSRLAVLAPRGGVLADEPGLFVTNDGGAPTILVRSDGDFAAHGDILENSTQVAFHLKRDAHALVIGSGGGRDVLAALASGQRRVTAVEINPAMRTIVTERFADYIGNLFGDPRVELHVQEGRNFVAGSPERYDVIQFTMIDSWGGAAAAGAYVFSENGLYTLEALGDYMDHLRPGGLVSMTRYYEWGEGLRLTNLFASYLIAAGHENVHERMLVLLRTQQAVRPLVTVVVKNGVFTPEEVRTTRDLVRASGDTILHAPYLGPEDLSPRAADRVFRALLAPAPFREARERVLSEYPRNLAPPTDDRPFFFFTRHNRDLFRTDRSEHAARRLAMPILYAMVLVFAMIAALTIFLPLALRSREAIRRAPHRRTGLAYFAMLGAGFMLVEVSLIQRLSIFLGHPTWSFVVVLSTLLLSSGLGSLASGRWPRPSPGVLAAVLAGIVVLVGGYAVFVYDRLIDLMWLDRTRRILVAAGMMAPAGFLMGMCFPLGVQIVRHWHETLVPWGWGVNGAFSVFASVLAIALAITVGFKAALVAGIACYATALGLALSWRGAFPASPRLRGGA